MTQRRQRTAPRPASSRRQGPRSATARRTSGPSAGVWIGGLAILLLGVFAIVTITGKDSPDAPEPAPFVATATVHESPTSPAETATDRRPDPPPLPEGLREQAQEVAEQIEPLVAEAKRLYDEGLRARKDGDPDAWQSHLHQASAIFGQVNDLWNSVIEKMPEALPHWDKEAVARHYLSKEAKAYTSATEMKAALDKQIRPR